MISLVWSHSFSSARAASNGENQTRQHEMRALRDEMEEQEKWQCEMRQYEMKQYELRQDEMKWRSRRYGNVR